MPKTVVHMIGQAHLDPVWLWRWTEGRAEALGASQSAVDRLAEFPAFHFTRGEAQVYRWIAEENPVLFKQVQAAIEAGRWHVVNGMVIQPDMNLPQGESFVRQVLLGKAYMAAMLGVEPDIAYCVDSFGHAGTLPQILHKCGFRAYVFMRPGPHEKELPASVFWWQGPDGSRILTYRIAAAYTTRDVDHAQHIAYAVEAMPPQLEHTMCFFGVGNHGGGPTVAQIANVQALAATSQDLEIHFSWPDAYFDAIAPAASALPTVAEELQFHAVGCYSVVSALKRAHRQAECNLMVAERLATLAQVWTGGSPLGAAPAAGLHELWWTLCFNQFHDTLGGSAIKTATDDAIHALGGVIAAAGELADDAGRAIAAQVNTAGPGGVVVIFNPAAQPSSQYVEYEPWTNWEGWREGGWGLLDATGAPVPYQLIETQEALGRAGHGLTRLAFRAELPALGYQVFRFTDAAAQAPATGSARATERTLENDRLLVTLDSGDGRIVSCVDKATGIQLVGPQGWNVAQVLDDPSDTWSHGVQRFGPAIDTFGGATITVGDMGPLQASLVVERTYLGNTWLQEIILRHGEQDILIRNWLVWQGRFRMLKLAFDVATGEPQACHDIPFGWCQRACDGREYPTQMWMDVSGPAAMRPSQVIGAALLNDGKYGCDVTGSVMRLTVLRCPPYAFHEPHPFGLKRRYDWVDQGEQEFTLVVRPHIGDWRAAGVVQRARELNCPPVAVTAHGHAGTRPARDSLLALSSAEMELTALKPAEDGNGYIVRLADCHGRGGSGELQWAGARFPVTLAPFEVATLRVAQEGDVWRLTPCNMVEVA